MGSLKGGAKGRVDQYDGKRYDGSTGRESGPQLASVLFLGLGKIPLIVTSPLAGKKKPLTINHWKRLCKANPAKLDHFDALRPLLTESFVYMFEDTDPVNSQVGGRPLFC